MPRDTVWYVSCELYSTSCVVFIHCTCTLQTSETRETLHSIHGAEKTYGSCTGGTSKSIPSPAKCRKTAVECRKQQQASLFSTQTSSASTSSSVHVSLPIARVVWHATPNSQHAERLHIYHHPILTGKPRPRIVIICACLAVGFERDVG